MHPINRAATTLKSVASPVRVHPDKYKKIFEQINFFVNPV